MEQSQNLGLLLGVPLLLTKLKLSGQAIASSEALEISTAQEESSRCSLILKLILERFFE